MVKKTYQYGHRSAKHRHVVAAVILVCIVIFVPLAYFVYKDVQNNGDAQVEGTAQVVGQVVGDSDREKLKVDEQTYTMTLPGDWKNVARIDSTNEHSVSWQSTKKKEDARWLKVYVDSIPSAKAVNRLMPVTVHGTALSAGDVSDNCISFTGSGTIDARNSSQQQPTAAKWQGVAFICNLPNFVDNEVGVGTIGSPTNQVTVVGTSQGSHTYFFLYTDRTIQPNYTILSDALDSFHAK